MTLSEHIQKDITTAMKARDEQRLSCLRRERLARGYALERHEIQKYGAGENVDRGHREDAERERSRHRPRRILCLAAELGDLPPPTEREETADHRRSEGARERIRSWPLRNEGHEVRPIARLECEGKDSDECQRADLQDHEPLHHARAEPDA